MTKQQTKKDKSDWFDSHVVVLGPDSDFEDKMREALKNKVCQENQTRPARKTARRAGSVKLTIMSKGMARADDELCRLRENKADETGAASVKARAAWLEESPQIIRKIDAALKAVNGKAQSFAVTRWRAVAVVADRAEKLLADRGVAKKSRAGARLVYRPEGPTANRYKYSAISTEVELTRTSGGWFVTHISAATVYPRTAERFDLYVSGAAKRDIVDKAMAGVYLIDT